VPHTECYGALRFRRRAFRRAVGALVLLLLGAQAPPRVWSACGDDSARPGAVVTPGMAHHSDTDGQDAQRRDAPKPAHGSDCDHQLAAGLCGLGGNCVTAPPSQAMASAPLRGASPERAFPAPDGLPASLDVAPDVPPPRA